MSLQTLPDDILLGILQNVSSWTKYGEVDFKHQLNILAVFQRLRAISLPKIYNHVYLTFNNYRSYMCQRYTNKFCKSFANYIVTNADIIAFANCTRMVKAAKISVDGLSITYTELHDTIEAFQLCANTWPNITKLEIAVGYNFYSHSLSESDWMQHCRLDKKYSQELANIIPCVTELTLLNACYNSANDFYSQVVDAYADQLVKLDNMEDFDHIDRQKLNVLQYLQLSMGGHMKLPRANCHTLVDLRIYNIADNVSWAPFLDSKTDTVVEFTCLESLRLSFLYDEVAERADENMPELLLKFPVLSSLTITFYAEVCPFLKMAVLPNNLKDISDSLQPGWSPDGNKIVMRRL